MSALRSSSERSSAPNAGSLKAGVRLVQGEIDEMALFDGLLVGIEEGRRLVAALENAERVSINECRRGCGQADHAGIKIFDHFGKAIEDRAMGFVEDDKVKKAGRELLVADAHRLLRGDVEPLVWVDIRCADADARLIRQKSLEAVVQRLFDKCVTVGKKKNLLRIGALQKNVDQPHSGSGFPRAGRHDEQGAAFAAFKGFGDSANGFVLVGAFDDFLIDRCIFKWLLVLADEAQASEIIRRRKIRQSSAGAQGQPPRKNDVSHSS